TGGNPGGTCRRCGTAASGATPTATTGGVRKGLKGHKGHKGPKKRRSHMSLMSFWSFHHLPLSTGGPILSGAVRSLISALGMARAGSPAPFKAIGDHWVG